MKKHYLKLITTISSSILSYSLLVAPFTSNAAMRPRTPSSPINSGMNGRMLFRPINPAGTSSTSGKLHRPTPINPLTTKFNPMYDSDSSSVNSASLKSVGSSSSLGSADFNSTLGSVHSNNGNNSHTNNTSTTSPKNTSNPSSSGNSRFRLKFTDYALMGITAASLAGLGVTISQLVDEDNNETNDNKPQLNEHVNQN
ncbi:hypothetical protein [Candidatus Arthromitus sp. SFB-turkey]|uniref:hypothetical protein n=1 Tax=Candidatus Arthromitus sp. SFB-turkey TaxID=1840217 RepID=UPI0007F4CFBE|nr:hypothetical protein [Candidatus Arthromitus sp. SFB-turkey]OAT88946.1 hypothetical protein A6P36_06305 [Candidatus Arthromitus sp. SFB-turkey]